MCYYSSIEEIEQIRTELKAGRLLPILWQVLNINPNCLAKQEHKKTWNNPQMYLKKGVLGPHYLLYKFKATDTLDSTNLKVLKIAGTLKYKVRETFDIQCKMHLL